MEVVTVSIAHEQERTRAISEEEREVVSATRKRLLKPVEFEEAIAYAPRRKQHDDSQQRRMGPNVGKVMRQLASFWEGKGALPDGSIYKAVAELALEINVSERQARTALDTAIEEGMLTRTLIIRPSDRREVYSYLPDPIRTLRVACNGHLENLRGCLAREGRQKYRAKLEEKIAGVLTTLSDLDEWFGPEPEWVPEQAGWVVDEGCPDLTEQVVPEAVYEEGSDWLLDAESDPTLTLNPSDNLSLTADTSGMLQKSNATRERHEVHASSSFTTQNWRGEGRFRAPSPRPDFEDDDEEVATSPPSRTDAPSSNTAGEVVEMLPTGNAESTTPRPEAVRALLAPDGALHDLVDDALEYGEQGVELLARHAARTTAVWPPGGASHRCRWSR